MLFIWEDYEKEIGLMDDVAGLRHDNIRPHKVQISVLEILHYAKTVPPEDYFKLNPYIQQQVRRALTPDGIIQLV